MLELTDYTVIEPFYEDENTIVYRGYRIKDRLPVIIKTSAEPYPPPTQIIRFHHEYEITHGLDLKSTIKSYELQKCQSTWALILEDIQGDSLKNILATQPIFPFNQEGLKGFLTFFRLAIPLTNSLGELHAHHIIHKDIKPANIIVNLETGLVKITDLSISSRLYHENQALINPNLLEGTLAYMSPEQTGRMNRTIDYRTDFYSLGVVFYEMLVGHLPFENLEVMELVHCHLAKIPPSPHSLNANIPIALSHIVMKLLAKTAEARYQSAYGLKADLQACLQQLQAQKPCTNFTLGKQDVSGQFQIPQKLYGRDAQIKTLLQAFERATNENGKTELMLVAGYSGIGKTALVREVHKPMTEKQGYFISGKFDQYQRNIPYSAFVNAFSNLVSQLLTETQAQLNQWQEKLLAALGDNGQVICDVISELELIIGKQPVVPTLPPLEAQNRFNLVFQQFIQIVSQPEHPLVLFLDDLQWADSASLTLMQLLMTSEENKALFLIGAYRDNEVTATHPLILTLEEIKNSSATVNKITLTPLALSDVNQLMADTLHGSLETVKPLAELVLAKTGGNPFFMNVFLETLYAEKLITYVYPKSPPTPLYKSGESVEKSLYESGELKEENGGAWYWDLAQIQAKAITDNVVELIAGKIQKLKLSTQHLLKIAACIGNQFELDTLSIVSEQTLPQVIEQLHEAVLENLLLPLGNAYKALELMKLSENGNSYNQRTIEYKFSHDRIQQAAYSLIPDNQKQSVHQQVGQLLLQNTSEDQLEGKIFDIVNQLNFATELLTQQSQREELAQLNLMAGNKAKAAAAYQPALRYFNIGRELLESVEKSPPTPLYKSGEFPPLTEKNREDFWHQRYELMLALHVESAETAYLTGDFGLMERLVQTVFEQAQSLLDKVEVYQVKIAAYQAQNQLLNALNTGLEVLKLLGISFPEAPNQADFMAALQETQAILADRPIAELIDLPYMTDQQQLAAVQILSSIFSASYQAGPAFMPLLVFKQVVLSVQYGNTPESAFAYANYGLILCALVSDIENGYQFGKLALKLLDKFDAKELKARTFVIMNNLVRHWKEHVKYSLPPLLEGYQAGLDTGDLEWAAWCIVVHHYHAYLIGRELPKLNQDMAQYNETIAKLKQETPLHWQQMYRQAVLNLLGEASGSPTDLIGESYNEAEMLPQHLKANDRTMLSHFYLNKIMLCYFFGEYVLAVDYANTTETYLDGAVGLLITPYFYFYDSLARLAVYCDKPNADIIDKVSANQEKIKNWAFYAPENFQHKYDLVEAEKARILGNIVSAMAFYDRAIQGARKQEYIQEEALAYERAAEFYLALGRQEIAQVYMSRARHGYTLWGAKGKLSQLVKKYPKLLPTLSTSSASTTLTFAGVTMTGSTILGSMGSSLDLTTVMKASQAIASEIKLDKLLAKLLTMVIENAGAQTGFLILSNQRNLTIEATGHIETEPVVLQSIPLSENQTQLSVAIVNYVMRTHDNVVLSDASQEGIFTEDSYVVKNKPKSILCAPIIQQGQLIGIIYLENSLTTEAFTPARLEVIKILSAQAAVSLENALLYRTLEQKVAERTAQLAEANDKITRLNERLQAENLRMAAELDVAEKLQKMVLPTDTELKEIEGLDIAGFMDPADEVGGDYYDVLEHNGHVKIGIGDVTGHGLQSGVLMLMVQMAVRTLLVNEISDPKQFLEVINRAIYDNVQRMKIDKNLTLALLDYQDSQLQLAGQHEEVLVVRKNGHVERVDTLDLGFPVGIEPTISAFVNQKEISLQPGDGVVLYTDGVTEACNVNKIQYGIKRLCQIVSRHWQGSALEIQQAVIADVRQHIGTKPLDDDITLLVLKQK